MTLLKTLRIVGACVCLALAAGRAWAEAAPPPGFVALFNGHDLEGWRGGDTFDPRRWAAMPEVERAALEKAWTAEMRAHWRVENGELINDGAGKYATTVREFGDFELLLEYRTVARADSGIYFRGCPQVQIWDYTDTEKFPLGAALGSGGLWNNSPGAPGKDPLVRADKPFGEWNQFRILMVGARVSVWLNGALVVDHALMENYFDRAQPVPVRGPIQLQTHGGEIRWRHVFIREIGAEEANRWLARHGDGAAFVPLFNGRDLTGWTGALDAYEVRDGTILCRPKQGGTLYTVDTFRDFVVRLEFKLPPGGNNGLAIRYPGSGDPAYTGMCESQILDDRYEEVTGSKLDPRQMHGSAYGMLAAVLGYQRPAGEWNFQEVTVRGSRIRVELNGTVVLDGDLATVTEFLDDKKHPGKDLAEGSFGFAGHGDPVAFRAITLRRLE